MITARQYRDEPDDDRMRALVGHIDALTGPRMYCTLGELDWWRFTDDDPQIAPQSQLWFDTDQTLIAFAWAEDRRREAGRRDEGAVTLTAWAFDSDRTRQTFLARRGYRPTGYGLCHRVRRLTAPTPVSSLPTGYVVGHMRVDAVASRVATHRDAFGSTKVSVAKYLAVMRAPTYPQDLDLVALGPDGAVAAFALVWLDEANRVGTFEPVGTGSSHRRLGLGRALMSEGLTRLRALGADTACVVTGSDDSATNGLYDAVEMPAVARNLAWAKQLDV